MADLSALETLTAYTKAFGPIPRDANELVRYSKTRNDLETISVSEAEEVIHIYKKNLAELRQKLQSGRVKYSDSRKHLVNVHISNLNVHFAADESSDSDIEEEKCESIKPHRQKSIFEIDHYDTEDDAKTLDKDEAKHSQNKQHRDSWDRDQLKTMIDNDDENDIYANPSYRIVCEQHNAILIPHNKTKKTKGFFDCCYELFWPSEDDL